MPQFFMFTQDHFPVRDYRTGKKKKSSTAATTPFCATLPSFNQSLTYMGTLNHMTAHHLYPYTHILKPLVPGNPQGLLVSAITQHLGEAVGFAVNSPVFLGLKF